MLPCESWLIPVVPERRYTDSRPLINYQNDNPINFILTQIHEKKKKKTYQRIIYIKSKFYQNNFKNCISDLKSNRYSLLSSQRLSIDYNVRSKWSSKHNSQTRREQRERITATTKIKHTQNSVLNEHKVWDKLASKAFFYLPQTYMQLS